MICTVETKTAMPRQLKQLTVHLNASVNTCRQPTIGMAKKECGRNIHHCYPPHVGLREIILAETGRKHLIQMSPNDYLKLLGMPSNSAEFHNEAFHLAYEAVTQNLEYNEWVSRGMLLKDIIITLNFIEDMGVESQAIDLLFLCPHPIWMGTYKKTEEEFFAACDEIESQIRASPATLLSNDGKPQKVAAGFGKDMEKMLC
ncbi:hypothetical protein QC762_405880 [Podospora pseudocomata]|uniref:Uncharacterized protein n=1 Tax=Podospora pseudocomata TaxID=2093779 RepID=A0ABR0GGZ5_9PEZI|nr:hypothetical protein QC762_405880 [Podospora pseudocomata]